MEKNGIPYFMWKTAFPINHKILKIPVLTFTITLNVVRVPVFKLNSWLWVISILIRIHTCWLNLYRYLHVPMAIHKFKKPLHLVRLSATGPTFRLSIQYFKCPEMDIFLEVWTFSSYGTLCICANDFQGLSKAFHYPIPSYWLFICVFEITY